MSDSTTTIYVPPSMRRFEPHRAPSGGWRASLPLAYDLVEAVQPDLLVAVGVHRGANYFAYCQSVREHGLSTACYAVGAWQEAEDGDGPAALHDFRDHGRWRYYGFSYPLPMAPGEAAGQFSNESVALVHLDAGIREPDVPRELRRWDAKLRPGGLLVCRAVGTPGSASRTAWEALAADGKGFLFSGSPALGVLRKPGGTPLSSGPPLLRHLFGGDAEDGDRLRAVYRRIARYLELSHHTDPSEYGRARRERDGRRSEGAAGA